MLEKVLINKLIRGLNNIDLQKHVQFQRAKTLDAAISYAIEYEAFMNPQNHMKKPFSNEPSHVLSIQAIKDKISKAESVTLDQMAKLIDEKLNEFAKTGKLNSKYQNASPRYNGRGRGQYFRNQNNMTNRICYKCNKMGHIQYYCP